MKAKLIFNERTQDGETSLYLTEDGQFVKVYGCPASYYYQILHESDRVVIREGGVDYNDFPFELGG